MMPPSSGLGRLKRAMHGALVIVSLAVSGSASAQVRNLTWGELSLTPPVCMDVQGIGLTGWVQHFRHSPRAPYWEGLLGNAFWDMHHYCWALVHQQRANRSDTPPQTREHLHRTAINDYYYIINNAIDRGQKDLVILPELYYRAGDAYLQINDLAAAMIEFEKARAAKPDYWPAYVGLASVQERLGRRKEAREILERALESMPDEAGLKAALAKLGRAAADSKPPAPARRSTTEPASGPGSARSAN